MHGLADLLYPTLCSGCSRPSRGGICNSCYAEVPRIGSEVCSRCGRPGAPRPSCIDCRGRELHFDWARQAAEFSPLVRKSVHQFKYSGLRVLEVFLAALIVELVEKEDIDLSTVTWVPASQRRLRTTGVDHGRILAQRVAQCAGVESAPMLVRTRSSAPQMRMEPEARRSNLVGAFAATSTPPASITLIDDVYTTGSTAAEAARALKAAGASHVKVLCVARSFESL